MSLKITFLGAARNVTGSKYLVEFKGRRILVDCGLYQERDFKPRNWEPFSPPPGELDAIVLTHAHLDHCGLIPRFVAQGFAGSIHCTGATADITRIVLLDSAHIQEEDIRYKQKRHAKEGRKSPYPYEPLYTTEQTEACLGRFQGHPYSKTIKLFDGISIAFLPVGHILGASSVKFTLRDGAEERILLFSGDIGRWNMPILEDPVAIGKADYVVMESTYGNRLHEDNHDIPRRLADCINDTVQRGGKLVIPSFSVERSQDLLYHLNNLLVKKRIPSLPVILDSPMAIRVTEVFEQHPELFDDKTVALIKAGKHPCDFPSLRMTRSTEESKAINSIKEPVVIIAGSGMCTGGRIKHHLKNNITHPESTLLFIGYQAQGTLGRHILEAAEQPPAERGKIRIHGEKFPLMAQVERIGGFSAHADRDELLRWLGTVEPRPKRVFVTHGEEKAAEAFGRKLTDGHYDAHVPEYKESVALA